MSAEWPTPVLPGFSLGAPVLHQRRLLWVGMNTVWAAAGAAAGWPVGAALRGPVFRLSVASGDPDRRACPRCAAPTPRWPAFQCGHCGAPLGATASLEVSTALVLALLAGRFGGRPDLPAFAFLGALGVALAAIDIAVQRLPDRLVLPAYPAAAALLTAAAVAEHNAGALTRALLGGLALGGGYLLLALVSRGQMGGGDVKLAGLAGLALGWLGWPTLLAGALLGFLLSGAASLALLAARRISLRSQISFGPFLLGGALLAILAGGR